jgi:hypothetical protein
MCWQIYRQKTQTVTALIVPCCEPYLGLNTGLMARFNRSNSQDTDSVMTCIVTIGEIGSFARKLGWGNKKLNDLQNIISELVWIDIGRDEVIEAYSEIDHYSEKGVKPAHPMGQKRCVDRRSSERNWCNAVDH